MATIATPPPATDVVAVAPPVAPPQVFQDAAAKMAFQVQQRLAERAAAAPVETPVPLSSALEAAAQPSAAETAQIADAAPPVEVVPELDLENIDFDAPETPGSEAVVAAAGAAPVEDHSEPWKALQQAVETGDLDKIESAFLRTSRGKKTLETFKILREAEKPVEADGNGGIGHFPTLDEIRQGYTHTLHVEGMRSDYVNDPVSFVHNMLVPNEQGQTYLGQAQHAAKILRAIPQELLRAGHHQLFENEYLAPALGLYLDKNYETALAMPDSDQKFRLLDSLRVLEFNTFGAARPLPGETPANAPAAEDPAFRRLKQERDQAVDLLNRQATQRQRDVVTTFQMTSAEQGAQAVDRVLEVAGLKKAYPGELLEPYKVQIYNLVHSKVMGLGQSPADPGGKQTLDMQLQAALRNGGDTTQAKATYRRMFLTRLQHDPEVKSKILNLVTVAKSRADSSIAGAQAAQMRTEPVGTGSPAPASVVTPASQLTRQPGENSADFMARQVIARRQQAPVR